MSYKIGETVDERRARWRRNYQNVDKAKRRATKRKYHSDNKSRQAAHTLVFKARKCGLLQSPEELACCACGGDAREYHHPHGYEGANALRVQAVCRPCHKALDGYRRGDNSPHYKPAIDGKCGAQRVLLAQ